MDQVHDDLKDFIEIEIEDIYVEIYVIEHVILVSDVEEGDFEIEIVGVVSDVTDFEHILEDIVNEVMEVENKKPWQMVWDLILVLVDQGINVVVIIIVVVEKMDFVKAKHVYVID